MMPVPPECSTAICALRDYVDARFRSLEDAIQLRAETHERALEIAHRGMEKRLEGMNEFRAQLEKQAGTFVDRRAHEVVEGRLNVLEQANANLVGRVAMAITAITLAFAALQIALHFLTATK